MHASDSAVADAITAMEKSIGSIMFNRQRSRGATLTSDGLATLPVARQILADSLTLTASVGRAPSAIVGPVRIGISNTLASVLLPRLIANVRHTHPGIHIEFRVDDLAALTKAAEESLLDLIITFDIDVPPEYQRRSLCSTEATLVVSADHRLARNTQVNLLEVADEPMVLLDITASRSTRLS